MLFCRPTSGRRAPSVLALAALTCAPACAPAPGATPATGRVDAPPPTEAKPLKNLVLVVVDTLRADHIGPGGYARNTTPVLDALATRSAVFEKAISHSPRTRTSMGALLTGLLPSASGLTCQLLEGACGVLPSGVTTLAETLSAAGFETAAVTSNVNVDPVFGFAQGFDQYAVVAPEPGTGASGWLRQSTEEVTERGLAALEALHDGRFLLYLHYLDPHSPYEPPREHQVFRAESYRTGERTAVLLSRYDGEIRHVDANLGHILARLAELGRTDDTAVVVVSDHGEEFNDHGGWNHGTTLYDEVLHVPLLMTLPGYTAGERVAAQVGLIDVVPTVLEALGLPTPPALQGSSLLPLVRGSEREDRATVSEAGATPLASLRRPPWKLIVDLESNAVELFDVGRDPHERHELSHEHPELVAELRAELDGVLATSRRIEADIERTDSDAPTITDEHRELMKALGYVEDGS